MAIRRLDPSDVDAVVDLSIRAWTPVFASLERALGPALFDAMHPDGWESLQAAAVRATLQAADFDVWVADHDGTPVGFVAVRLLPDHDIGEVYMIAVDPDHQGRRIGRELTDHAVAHIRDAGLAIAMIETGGDPGHAPARALYEHAGFVRLPIARYFRKL
jgi:ribosomal protein S18 acetylase RimI-like enzyme